MMRVAGILSGFGFIQCGVACVCCIEHPGYSMWCFPFPVLTAFGAFVLAAAFVIRGEP